jgi:hypothetical protein
MNEPNRSSDLISYIFISFFAENNQIFESCNNIIIDKFIDFKDNANIDKLTTIIKTFDIN